MNSLKRDVSFQARVRKSLTRLLLRFKSQPRLHWGKLNVADGGRFQNLGRQVQGIISI